MGVSRDSIECTSTSLIDDQFLEKGRLAKDDAGQFMSFRVTVTQPVVHHSTGQALFAAKTRSAHPLPRYITLNPFAPR